MGRDTVEERDNTGRNIVEKWDNMYTVKEGDNTKETGTQ